MINKSDITFRQNKGEFVLSLKTLPYLADHAFQGMIVLPGSAYIEMALLIYDHLYHKTPGVLKDVYFNNIVLLSEKQTKIAFEIKEKFNDELKLEFSEITDTVDTETDNSPITHLSVKSELIKPSHDFHHRNIEEFQKNATINVRAEDFYKKLSENGNQYGLGFQKIKEIWVYENTAICKLVNTPNENNNLGDDHFLHPSLLDSFTQLLSALSDSKGRTFVLNSIGEIKICDLKIPEEIWGEAKLLSDSSENENGFYGDLKFLMLPGKFI